MSELLIELTEMVGHTEALQIIDAWQEDDTERYAEEMTARWQAE